MQRNKSRSIPVAILVGGQSQRLRVNKQYKWQLPFSQGKSVLDFIIKKNQSESDIVLLNCPSKKNSKGEQLIKDLSPYSLPLIHDISSSFEGPLLGLLSCLHWAKENQHPWIATTACDTPFFPKHIISILEEQRLKDKLSNDQNPKNKQNLAYVVSYNGKLQPIFGLWSINLIDELTEKIENKNKRAIGYWAKQHAKILPIDTLIESTDTAPLFEIDPFFNINTLDDYKIALKKISSAMYKS